MTDTWSMQVYTPCTRLCILRQEQCVTVISSVQRSGNANRTPTRHIRIHKGFSIWYNYIISFSPAYDYACVRTDVTSLTLPACQLQSQPVTRPPREMAVHTLNYHKEENDEKNNKLNLFIELHRLHLNYPVLYITHSHTWMNGMNIEIQMEEARSDYKMCCSRLTADSHLYVPLDMHFIRVSVDESKG